MHSHGPITHSCTARAQQEPKPRDWGRDESEKSFATREKVGGRDRVRTCDPLLAKQVLSQLSYTPTRCNQYTLNSLQRVLQVVQLRLSVHSVQQRFLRTGVRSPSPLS